MRALVTGGAGFIGSHLAEALARRGHEVVVLDDFSLGARQNLSWMVSGDGVEILEGTICDDATVREAMGGCDWVFHHAAWPSVPRSVEFPKETNAINLDATLRLLSAARDHQVSRFIFASSSSIYGDVEGPLKAEALPPNPLSPYALQKYASERYCQLFHTLFGLSTVSLRYFNVFGPRQSFNSPYSGVIAQFCTAFLRDEAPVIYGDGLQSRDFTYIDNIVDANLRAVEAPAGLVSGRVFNIACGVSISLLDLVRDLQRLTGKSLEPQFRPGRIGDVRHSRADVAAARSCLGFTSRTTWRQGIESTYEWYRATAGR